MKLNCLRRDHPPAQFISDPLVWKLNLMPLILNFWELQQFFRPFERWELDEKTGNFTQTLSETKLQVYVWYPESFLVDFDFCNNWFSGKYFKIIEKNILELILVFFLLDLEKKTLQKIWNIRHELFSVKNTVKEHFLLNSMIVERCS